MYKSVWEEGGGGGFVLLILPHFSQISHDNELKKNEAWREVGTNPLNPLWIRHCTY